MEWECSINSNKIEYRAKLVETNTSKALDTATPLKQAGITAVVTENSNGVSLLINDSESVKKFEKLLDPKALKARYVELISSHLKFDKSQNPITISRDNFVNNFHGNDIANTQKFQNFKHMFEVAGIKYNEGENFKEVFSLQIEDSESIKLLTDIKVSSGVTNKEKQAISQSSIVSPSKEMQKKENIEPAKSNFLTKIFTTIKSFFKKLLDNIKVKNPSKPIRLEEPDFNILNLEPSNTIDSKSISPVISLVKLYATDNTMKEETLKTILQENLKKNPDLDLNTIIERLNAENARNYNEDYKPRIETAKNILNELKTQKSR
ncbi:MAG: hypothetical protein ACK4OM_01780 [Alphaproteobacteria bacterium]